MEGNRNLIAFASCKPSCHESWKKKANKMITDIPTSRKLGSQWRSRFFPRVTLNIGAVRYNNSSRRSLSETSAPKLRNHRSMCKKNYCKINLVSQCFESYLVRFICWGPVNRLATGKSHISKTDSLKCLQMSFVGFGYSGWHKEKKRLIERPPSSGWLSKAARMASSFSMCHHGWPNYLSNTP